MSYSGGIAQEYIPGLAGPFTRGWLEDFGTGLSN